MSGPTGELWAEVRSSLGCEVVAAARVSGGDISEAWRLGLADGRTVFLKHCTGAPPSLFPAEASGLTWLAEADAIGVPEVLAVGEGRVPWLALAWLEPGPPASNHDEALGTGLARLHAARPASFGLDHDNFIGTLPQANGALPTWAAFYGERRLRPQVERAVQAGLLPAALRRDLERLIERLPRLVGPMEPPARLHGDLWAGNAHIDQRGRPVLIDPAVYGGHREVDLAMMRLFGGFAPDVFAAYTAATPLAPGHEARVSLYQLYPLLVHLNLFGTGYLRQVAVAVAPHL